MTTTTLAIRTRAWSKPNKTGQRNRRKRSRDSTTGTFEMCQSNNFTGGGYNEKVFDLKENCWTTETNLNVRLDRYDHATVLVSENWCDLA